MRKRSLVSMVILSIITCGIMQLVYFYQVMSDINYASKENDTAGTDLLLTIITCGLWGIYCYWKYSKKLVNLGGEDNSIINVILAVLGFQIISLVILQSSINNLIDRQSSY
ncbi:DUF4234 domain-containing protein [Amedibacillus sp. YH-ame10]